MVDDCMIQRRPSTDAEPAKGEKEKRAKHTRIRPSAWFGHVPHCSDERAHVAIFTAPRARSHTACVPVLPYLGIRRGMQWRWCSCSALPCCLNLRLFPRSLASVSSSHRSRSPQAMSPLRSQANALPFRSALVSLCVLLALASVVSCGCANSGFALPAGHTIQLPGGRQSCGGWQVMDNQCRNNPSTGCCTTGWFQFHTVSFWFIVTIQQYFCLRKSTDCSVVTLF